MLRKSLTPLIAILMGLAPLTGIANAGNLDILGEQKLREVSTLDSTNNITSDQLENALFPSIGSIAQAQDWSSLEQQVIIEHNKIRQNPQSYIPILEKRLASMDADGNIPNGCGSNCTFQTNEGQSAVQEAIQFLRQQQPLSPLKLSKGAAQAAKDHAVDQSENGGTGHVGSDGSDMGQRVKRYVKGITSLAENISYGQSTAQEVIMQLVIDDGNSSRGHRTNIFNSERNAAGAGCSSHPQQSTICVIDYLVLPNQ